MGKGSTDDAKHRRHDRYSVGNCAAQRPLPWSITSHDEWEHVRTAGETLTHFGWHSLRHNRSRAAAQISVADCTSWDALMASRPRKSAHLVDPRERTLIESKKPV